MKRLERHLGSCTCQEQLQHKSRKMMAFFNSVACGMEQRGNKTTTLQSYQARQCSGRLLHRRLTQALSSFAKSASSRCPALHILAHLITLPQVLRFSSLFCSFCIFFFFKKKRSMIMIIVILSTRLPFTSQQPILKSSICSFAPRDSTIRKYTVLYR